MVKRTIYIPEWLESKISDLAKSARRSFSAQVLVMLERYIFHTTPPISPYYEDWRQPHESDASRWGKGDGDIVL